MFSLFWEHFCIYGWWERLRAVDYGLEYRLKLKCDMGKTRKKDKNKIKKLSDANSGLAAGLA